MLLGIYDYISRKVLRNGNANCARDVYGAHVVVIRGLAHSMDAVLIRTTVDYELLFMHLG